MKKHGIFIISGQHPDITPEIIEIEIQTINENLICFEFLKSFRPFKLWKELSLCIQNVM